jgi:hypothetical protein
MVDSVITFTPGEVSAYYAARVPHLKQRRAAEWRGPCPVHRGKNDNFAVEPDTGRWFCFSACGRGGDILELEAGLTGADFKTAKTEVFRLVGRVEPDYTRTNGSRAGIAPTKPSQPTAAARSVAAAFATQPLPEKSSTPTGAAGGWREIERYPYMDRSGNLLFQVVRYLKPDGNKGIKQCRPDGKGGTVWNLRGVELVPYRLPELLKAHTVYLPEGEKDVHTLEEWGLVASCNPGGSGNSDLYAGWTGYFQDKHIVITVDNDEPGRKHAAAKAEALLAAAASVRIVELPDLPAKGDVTDWRNAGGTFEQFRKLVAAAKPMNAAALSELRERWRRTDEGSHGAPRAGSLVTRRLSEIEAKPVRWLWPGRIARGKVSIIAGNPGLGKSQVTAGMAAIITTGGLWPVDRSQCIPGDVVFLSAEDDPADTLRPRLEAAGANLQRVHVIDGVIRGFTGEGRQQNRLFSLQEDIEALSLKLAELGDVAAVVIDPITAYLGDVDSHRNAEVRALLASLSALAAQHGTAIIGVSHLNKSVGTEALMRVTGSLGFVAAARAAYLVAQDPQDPARRFVLPLKNNIGPDSEGLAFRIEGAIVQSGAEQLETSRVVWESEPVTTTADEVMRTALWWTAANSSALREAKEWLQETLSEPTLVAEVVRMAKEAGISDKTLRRASEGLRVVRQKTGMKGGWVWSLPPNMPKAPEHAQAKCVGTFEEVGHLRESDESAVTE